jgi:uncharacterized protein
LAIDPDYVASPCIRVCWVDPKTDQCAGCHRTLDEIARWGGMTPAQRRALLVALSARAAGR